MSHYMTLFIAQLHFILYKWRWMMFHPKHVWLNNMNFKNIVWFIKAISYFVLLRGLGNLSIYINFPFTKKCTTIFLLWLSKMYVLLCSIHVQFVGQRLRLYNGVSCCFAKLSMFIAMPYSFQCLNQTVTVSCPEISLRHCRTMWFSYGWTFSCMFISLAALLKSRVEAKRNFGSASV